MLSAGKGLLTELSHNTRQESPPAKRIGRVCTTAMSYTAQLLTVRAKDNGAYLLRTTTLAVKRMAH